MNVDNTAHRHISARDVALNSLFVPLVTPLFKLSVTWIADRPHHALSVLVIWIVHVCHFHIFVIFTVCNFQLRAIAKYVKLFLVREIFPLIGTTKNYTFL